MSSEPMYGPIRERRGLLPDATDIKAGEPIILNQTNMQTLYNETQRLQREIERLSEESGYWKEVAAMRAEAIREYRQCLDTVRQQMGVRDGGAAVCGVRGQAH